MSSEALERAKQTAREALEQGVLSHQCGVDAIAAFDALLAEVARLELREQQARARLHRCRDDFHAKVIALQAAFAVAREREQRAVRRDDWLRRQLDGALESAETVAGATGLALARAVVGDLKDALAALVDEPAAATLAEEGGRASNRAADAPSLAGWSSVGGASTEPSDCAPSSASAAADERCWVVGCSEPKPHHHFVSPAGTLEVSAAADEPGETP